MLMPVRPVRDPARAGRPKAGRLVAAMCATTAVSASLLLHGSLPLAGRFFADARAISTLELFAYAPPVLLPVDVVDREGPAADPEPEGPEAKSQKQAPSGAEEGEDPSLDTLAAERALAAAEPVREPREPETPNAEPPQEPTPVEVAALPSSERSRVARPSREALFEQRRLHAERLMALRKLRASAAKQGAGGDGEGAKKGQGGKGGGEGGGSARAQAAKGEPDAIYACTKDGLGDKVDVRFDRPVSDWVTVVPTVLMPFRARPSLGEYLDGVSQVVSRRRGTVARAGPVEFALPATVLQMDVDDPRGVRVALGHLDGRCLVGLKYTKQLFPLTVSRVPMRVVDHANRSQSALVDITLYKDASFSLEVIEGSLPFHQGSLANAKGIRDTIEQHYAAARVLKEVAGWFGVDVAKVAREARVERAKERSAQNKRVETAPAKKGDKVVRRR